MWCPEVGTKRISLSKIIKSCHVQEEKSSFVLRSSTGGREHLRGASGELVQETERIISQAQAEAKIITETAYQEGEKKGYEEGFARGLAEGKKAGLAQVNETYRQALNVLSEAEKYRLERIERLEPEIVKLATAMAEKIIFAQLTMDKQMVARIARHAMKILVAPEEINIYVHPQDAEELIAQESDAEAFGSVPIKIIRKSDLDPGSCIIETDKGVVDGSVNTQIKELKKMLEIA